MAHNVKNRLTGTCETCRYLKASADMIVPAGYTCARFPPSAQVIPVGGRIANATSWPVVQLTDGCGEHRAAILEG